MPWKLDLTPGKAFERVAIFRSDPRKRHHLLILASPMREGIHVSTHSTEIPGKTAVERILALVPRSLFLSAGLCLIFCFPSQAQNAQAAPTKNPVTLSPTSLMFANQTVGTT